MLIDMDQPTLIDGFLPMPDWTFGGPAKQDQDIKETSVVNANPTGGITIQGSVDGFDE